MTAKERVGHGAKISAEATAQSAAGDSGSYNGNETDNKICGGVPLHHSARKASTGFTIVARRAGKRQASNAARPRTATVALSSIGL